MRNPHAGAIYALIFIAIFSFALPYFNPLEAATPSAIASAPKVRAATISSPDYPVRVIIPSIKVDSSVLAVGTNKKGEMDVPSGASTNVGWYKHGTVPGNSGNAVFDAHVFAAFSKLKNLKPGSDVYVVTSSGRKLHFVVSNKQTYALTDLSPTAIFGPSSEKHLNLITCAGSLTKDRSTYDHRLVVYTTLVGSETA